MLFLVSAQSIGERFAQPFLRRVDLTGPRQHFDLDRLDGAFVEMLIQLAAMPADVLGRRLGIALHEGEGETRKRLIRRAYAR
jgi:hypothetical protein